MRYLLSLILSLVISATAFAGPGYIQTASRILPLTYLGSTDTCDIYATQSSLNFLDMYSRYRENKIWNLYICYAPNDENFRQKFVSSVAGSKSTVWFNTPSGSRKLWGIYTEMTYKPALNLLQLSLPEEYINDNGEIIGQSSNVERVENNDLNKRSPNGFMAQMVRVVNSYLEKNYPPRRTNVPHVE